MDRLTKKIDGGYTLKLPEDKSISDLEIKFNVYDKLGELEDLAEQGRLFILPCKQGDTVYTPWAWGVENDIVGSIEYVNDKMYVKNYYGGIIGEASSVFLTEDEAIRKYEELYGEN